MKKILIVLIGIALCYSQEGTHHRVKRKVLFSKNSKLFLRLNGKDNVIPWNQIFAHGWAFRINWDLPDTPLRRHKFFKREVEAARKNLKHVQGYSCILKHICHFIKSIKISSNCGIFCKVGHIITQSRGVDVDFFHTVHDLCNDYVAECPHMFHDTGYSYNNNL
ncbi:hypothetical protein FQR65_LT07115 [Abscondita terminalis]|nr:hypothetical protein FQR65_LT07115 [Abscondita terminalis]